MSSFVHAVIPTRVPTSPLGYFLSVKEENKEKQKLFLDKCISVDNYNIHFYYQGTQRQNLGEPAARGKGFQLSGSNTQREEQEISNK